MFQMIGQVVVGVLVCIFIIIMVDALAHPEVTEVRCNIKCAKSLHYIGRESAQLEVPDTGIPRQVPSPSVLLRPSASPPIRLLPPSLSSFSSFPLSFTAFAFPAFTLPLFPFLSHSLSLLFVPLFFPVSPFLMGYSYHLSRVAQSPSPTRISIDLILSVKRTSSCVSQTIMC